MPTTFQTNPVALKSLLEQCESGRIQLPDFQRSWVWAEDRITSLIASVSRAFPIGALMTLASRAGADAEFARRPVEGARGGAKETSPDQLLLDGQQRMTSLYQACMRREVVRTLTPKGKLVRRWFYIDIEKALRSDIDREDAIVGVPENRQIRSDFDRKVDLDLSSPEREYDHMMFPLNQAFDWEDWRERFEDFWIARGEMEKRNVFRRFRNEVLENFRAYQVPVIALGHDTSHEAVCLVFEKVNTGGKPLDAFELLTAMYAAKGHKLRDDWLGADGAHGMQRRLAQYGRSAEQEVGVLSKVASTEVIQAIALRYTKRIRMQKEEDGVRESDLPAVRATRQSLLDLPLDEYLRYRDSVEEGYKRAAKFLRQQHVFRVVDLPYQTQLVPLAAIFAELQDRAEHAATMAKIARWYWCGIFGELYGSAVESRFAKDIVEVPAWIAGGPEPTTVRDGVFRADRLTTMRTRLSAAYKGIHALLMREGARDFRSGQTFGDTVFFEEAVDIHHIFPQKWCTDNGIPEKVFDTVINKTPLTYRTNRIIGGVAPSQYLSRLEQGRSAGTQWADPPIPAATLDGYLRSHGIDPALLRADDFHAFMNDRRRRLLALISDVTGHAISDAATLAVEEGEEVSDGVVRDSGMAMEAA